MNEINIFLTAWTNAERTRDTTFLDANLTDDFVGTGPLGFQLPKPAWLARHQGGDLRYDTFDLDEVAVRAHGPVAMVTARQTAVGTFQDHPLPEVLRDTLVLVNEGEAWRLAGIHMSFVAGTPGAPPIPGPALPTDKGTPSMTVTLDHTIVPATNKQTSAEFLGHILGLQPGAPWGPFVPLAIGNQVTLDFMDADHVPAHHYAFLIDEADFDPIFERIRQAGANFYADPGRRMIAQINHRFGGRGVYFDDPDGHLMEILTRRLTAPEVRQIASGGVSGASGVTSQPWR